MIHPLDAPGREEEIRKLFARKPALYALYREHYDRYRQVLERVPADGMILELGSGAGFVKDVIPEVITSDVTEYRGVDRVIDATRLPFPDQSLRAVFLMNVLHHISNAEAFFQELNRCLVIHGRALIVDQYPGYPSKWIYKYFHHEPFDPESIEWKFKSSGPLSSANGALPWMIFIRDRKHFESRFPHLKIQRLQTHTPFRYWLCGGLKSWSLLPARAYGLATLLDASLVRAWPKFGSFMDIEIERIR